MTDNPKFLQPITWAEAKEIDAELKKIGVTWKFLLAYFNVSRARELTQCVAGEIIRQAKDGRLKLAFDEAAARERHWLYDA